MHAIQHIPLIATGISRNLAYPLTHIQQGMVAHSNYADYMNVHTNQLIFRFAEMVQVDLLAKAIEAVVARHELLRSSIQGNAIVEARQIVHPSISFNLAIRDVSALEARMQEKQFSRFLEDDFSAGFDLAEPPLFRFVLFKFKENDWRLVWSYHAILVGGAAQTIVLSEMFSLYDALVQNTNYEFTEPGDYQKYITQLQQFDLAKAEAYWRKLLLGFKEPTHLNLPRPTQLADDITHHHVSFDLSLNLSIKLEKLAKQENITLNSLIQGAWGILLARYTNQNDVVFGAIRSFSKTVINNTVGLFANTLPIRAQFQPEETILEFIKKLREQHRLLHDYIHTPLVKIRDWSDIPSTMPLFETAIDFRPQTVDETLKLKVKNWQNRFCTTTVAAQYPLLLQVHGEGNHLTARLYYDAQRFSRDAIVRMVGHFQHILEAIVLNPQQKTEQLSILTAAEYKQVVQQWNVTARTYPKEKSINQLFSEQAEKTPHEIAVVFKNEKITYQELDRRSNQLAHYMQTQGVQQNTLVATCLERDINMIVAILAILKAGAAYIPVDPDYPVQRIGFMLTDSQALFVLTQNSLKELLKEASANTPQVILENIDLNKYSEKAIDVKNNGQDLAYIIFTSGSTGRPKGIALMHQTITNLVLWENTLQAPAIRKVTQFANVSFDVSVQEIFYALINGHELHIIPSEMRHEIAKWIDYIDENVIEQIFMPPALLELFAEEILARGIIISSITDIFVAGEALKITPTIRQFFLHHTNARLINDYGPSETHVITAYYLPQDPMTWPEFPSIGSAIANTQLYILDQYKQPVPIGVPGELFAGGDGLAQGYLFSPKMTAEKFIANSFVQNQHEKIYKTGDLVRWMPDGNIEFISRIDFQVKVRGFRIELGEIEAALMSHEAIAQCTVIVREETGDKNLVAYVVANKAGLESSALRTFLQAKLPYYMVPAAFIILNEIPLTPNGKIDKRALPAPNFQQLDEGHGYVAPRTHNETRLAAIWSEVLGKKKIGIYDNLFDLGGHSLHATQILARIRRAFNIDVPFQQLFNEPTIEGVLKFLESNEGQAHAVVMEQIQPVSRDVPIALSFPQQRLWFLYQLQPNSPFYNESLIFQIDGVLNLTVLEQALNNLIARHEILRTFIKEQDGVTIQVISKEAFVKIKQIDAKLEEVDNLIKQEVHQPFVLENEILIRATVLTISPQKAVLIFNLHHIIFDGWSIDIFIKEISQFYQAGLANKKINLPLLPVQYLDFTCWQQDWLQTPAYAEQLAYWKQQLQDAQFVLDLPGDKVRPPKPTYQGKSYSFVVNEEVMKKLQQITRQQNTTLFTTLLTAFYVLLYRYTKQTDILLGSIVANRNHPELEGLIGFFVNTLILRCDLSNNPSFQQALNQVHHMLLGAFAHQNIPFAKVIQELHPERSLDRNPIIQVLFTLENVALEKLKLPGAEVTTLPNVLEAAKFDLVLIMKETAQGLTGVFEYSTDLFSAEYIERFTQHYLCLLTSITEAISQPVAKLAILPTTEKKLLLDAWNQTHEQYAINCIHDAFVQQVEKTPHAIAVEMNNKKLTYKELNEQANQLAHYLQAQGVKKDQLVGLALSRSIEMIISLLAILKAGGAYVPIDIDYPAARVQHIVTDSQLKWVVTNSRAVEKLASIANDQELAIAWLVLDKLNLTEFSATNLTNTTQAENLAYVIYTSGSTGKPKGVLIEHRTVMNTILAQIKAFQINESTRLLQFASISFDAAVSEIGTTLLAGGALVLAEREQLLPGAILHETLQQEKISVVTLPPAALAITPANDLSELRTLVTAGDACSIAIVKAWGKNRLFINAYGPTEASICATLTECEADDLQKPSIGKPLQNVEVYVLDENLQPVPIGVTGELYIGGAGVARGYLNREDLSKEKFVANPFKDNERLYRSGDLVRWRADGNLDFIGRTDFQVKIRGFRVELGEIENTLQDYPGIEQVFVMVRNDRGSEKYLAAYLQFITNVPTAAEVRQFLQARLPDYMVPSAFIFLESFPLNNNGKIDRQQLPAPDYAKQTMQEYIAPRNQDEEKMATCWREVLELESVGVLDDFFELGGHSLLAAKLITCIRQAFSTALPLSALFEHPTVAGLIEYINHNQQEQHIAAPALLPSARKEITPISFAQQRLWFLNNLNSENACYYNIPVAFRWLGEFDQALFLQAVTQLMCRHELLRTQFVEKEKQICQVTVEPEINAVYRFIDVSKEANAEQVAKEIIYTETHRGFALNVWPLFRIFIIQVSVEQYILFVNMHHSISDGWSVAVFCKELAAYYHSQEELPHLPIQYADYTIWQNELIHSAYFNQQINYWKEKLSGELPILDLPTDYPRPTVQTFHGYTLHFDFSKEELQQLRELATENKATLFMLLSSICAVLLHKYSRQNDIILGTPVAGRSQAELENLIGFFVNTLVLRSDLSGNLCFDEFLAHNRQMILEAFAAQDVPFEQLVEIIKPERDLSRNPIFQAMVVLQNTPPITLNIEKAKTQEYAIEFNVAKFDVTFIFSETEKGLQAAIEYNTDLFALTTMQRLANHLQQLVQQILQQPKQRIDELNLLSAIEKQQVLQDWSCGEKSANPALCLHEIFAQQAEKNPHAIAVEMDDKKLTYKELNEQANQLAHYLQAQGVKKDQLVGLAAPRSLEMIVSLLAILKAGAAYVPIDIDYPAARIQHILQDSQLQCLISTAQALLKFTPLIQEANLTVNCIALDNLSLTDFAQENLKINNNANQLAYVIYTSGSTGKPKGVLVEHGTVINTLLAAIKALNISPESRVLQFASISFDAAIWEIGSSLLAGSTLVLATREELLPGKELHETLQKQKISVATLPPAALAITESTDLASLRTVVTAGDACSLAIVKAWGKNRLFINAYGPTETSICATLTACDVDDLQKPSIGKPLQNVEVYVLDENLQSVPIGVTGELYIGGAGVARGYLNREDLTEEKFITNPFNSTGRLYRSGDLVRWRADGNLDFVGRTDFQVKIRGFRIELGEIAAQIEAYPIVQQAIVLAVGQTAADKQLIAYVQCKDNEYLDINHLRDYLKNHLPAYMVPAGFSLVPDFPLTTNGKIDTKKLIEMSPVQHTTSNFIAPRTATEKTIANIWQELLHIPNIGIQDSFFDLGGTSLLITQFTLTVRQLLNANIPVRLFFEQPTIEGLAKYIDQQNDAQNSEGSVMLMQVQQDTQLIDQITMNVALSDKAYEPQAVLLTGVTGFLGAFLLQDLLACTAAKIYCLIRAKDEAEGKQRLLENLKHYQLGHLIYSARIKIVLGDLAQPNLGLSENIFADLSKELDAIYHNGAFVHSVYPYAQLRAANVLGTVEIIKLATQNKAKPIHYISTISAATKLNEKNYLAEDFPAETPGHLVGGYPLSKWVAEKLITAIGEKGLPITIYRAGSIAGQSQTGVCNTNDSLLQIIKGCMQLGAAPDWQLDLAMVPVDYVSLAIVATSLQKESNGKVLQIYNPNALNWKQFIHWLNQDGCNVALMSMSDWQKKLINEVNEENALYAQLPRYLAGDEEESSTAEGVEISKTQAWLMQLGVIFPAIDEKQMRIYFAYLKQIGYL